MQQLCHRLSKPRAPVLPSVPPGSVKPRVVRLHASAAVHEALTPAQVVAIALVPASALVEATNRVVRRLAKGSSLASPLGGWAYCALDPVRTR